MILFYNFTSRFSPIFAIDDLMGKLIKLSFLLRFFYLTYALICTFRKEFKSVIYIPINAMVLKNGIFMGWSHYGIRMTQERLKTVLLTHEYDDLKKAKMPLRRRNIKLMPISA